MEIPSAYALLAAAQDLQAQVCLLILHAVLWWLFIKWSSKAVVDPFVRTKPWRAQWLKMQKAFFKKALFTSFDSDDDAFDFACIFQALLVQHFMGGLLCLPSVLGFKGSVISSFARQGALCEAGWELQDFIVRAQQRFFQGEKGRGMQPAALLLVCTMHHAMGQAMCIPMNMLYPDSPDYHEFVCLLQLAAFIAMGLQSYGYTLDVGTRSGLFQMKVTVTMSWVTIFYSRVLRFIVLGYRLINSFASDGNWTMLYVGCIVMVLMGFFNIMVFVDATAKLNKFAAMPLPPKVPAMPRQSRENGATSVPPALLVGACRERKPQLAWGYR